MTALIYRCPDCRTPTDTLRECATCRRRFAGPVVDLRPLGLSATNLAEDAAGHIDAGPPTWRRLFSHKHYWLEWCEQRWLPLLLSPATRTFLELGGGLCYASALAKAMCPKATVVATDVSPRYLERHALKVGEILGTPADRYAAVDAETLPFADGQFDAVYAQVVLYRLPDPARALREIHRVLAPGGRFLGIERASPWLPPFSRRETEALRTRAEADGTRERAWRYRDWRRLAGEAGATVAVVPGRRVRAPWLRRAGNAVRQVYVTISMDTPAQSEASEKTRAPM